MWTNQNLIDILSKGGVVVMPTDTLYGIVGQAQNISTVSRIYNLKKRTREKPCLILIGNIKQLDFFSIILSEEQKNKLKEYWLALSEVEGSTPTSIVLDCLDETFSYLHRGTKTLAFRIPASQELRDLLLKVGPLIAPSSNPEGLSPAKDIFKAREYFGNSIDLYINGGKITGKASKIVKLHSDGSITVLRP